MNEKKPIEPELNEDQASEIENSEKVEIQIPQTEQNSDEKDVNNSELSIEELTAKIEELKEELTQAKDKSLRAAAEVDNIRRRTSNEQINIRKYAIEGFASEILSVKDSLDLAEQIELSTDNKDVIEKMHEGLVLTLKQLDKTFERFAIEIVDPEKGDKLDPALHQAMTVQPSDEVANNCVLSVIQKGYKLHDRLLRPAMVIIARTAEINTDSDQEKT